MDEVTDKILNICEKNNHTFLGFFDGIYKNSKSKLIIKCNIDSYVFNPVYGSYKVGVKCLKCFGTSKKKKSEMELIIQEICKNKNFKFLGYSSEKVNTKSRFGVMCNLHKNIWYPNYNNFVSKKSGCPMCGDTLMRTEESAIIKINDLCTQKEYIFNGFVGGRYLGVKTKLNLFCINYQNTWYSRYNNFVGNNSGCPICKKSKGERIIIKYFNEHKMDFNQQKTFNGCENKRKLRFDFYLEKYNLCVEYDGNQHFKEVSCWGGKSNLAEIQKRDNIKTEYCKLNNINLLRINYRENIVDKLNFYFLNYS